MRYLTKFFFVLTMYTAASASQALAASVSIPCSAPEPSHGLSSIPVADHERGYFFESLLPFSIQGVQFYPEQISGNGEALLGCCCVGSVAADPTEDRLETWSHGAVFGPTAATPAGYSLNVKSLNRDGTIAAGIFTPYPTGQANNYGLFRWPLNGQSELLSPYLLPPAAGAGLLGPVEISSDGDKIWFFCDNTYKTGYCPVTSAQPEAWVAEIWTRERSFTLANADLPNRFTYVTPLGNGTTLLAGVLGTSDFGLVGADRRFRPLVGFPTDFDPKNDMFITNRAATIIALERSPAFSAPLEGLWSAQGVALPVPVAPAPCPQFHVRIGAIDDSGSIFATAFCPALAGESVGGDIGLRISSAGPQTLGDWLRSHGVINDLPASAFATLVSDNGRTVYGQTADLIAIGGATAAGNKFTNCHDAVCQFVAHVP